MVEYSPRLELVIYLLSLVLSEIDKTRGMSSRAGYATRIP